MYRVSRIIIVRGLGQPQELAGGRRNGDAKMKPQLLVMQKPDKHL